MCISLSVVICQYVTLSETWRKQQSVDHLFWIKQNMTWTCVMGLELSKTFVIGLILFQVILAVLSLFGAHLVQCWTLNNNRKITQEFHGALHDHSCQYVLKIWMDAPSSMKVFQTEMVLLWVPVRCLQWMSSTWGNTGFRTIDLEMGRKNCSGGTFFCSFK